MSFKDYENLDVTRETASKKELRKLKKKYGVDSERNTRGKILCLVIILILTIATIILYGNIIKLSIDFITSMSVAYFGMFSFIVLPIYGIIQKRNTKENVCLAIFGIDALICMTSLIIANMAPIGGTLGNIILISGLTSFVLFFPLMYILNKLEQKR